MEEDQQPKTQTDANKGRNPPRKTAVGAGEGDGSGGDIPIEPSYGFSEPDPTGPKRELAVLEREAIEIIAARRALERERIRLVAPPTFGAPGIWATGNSFTSSEPSNKELQLGMALQAVLDEIREWIQEKPLAVDEAQQRISNALNS